MRINLKASLVAACGAMFMTPAGAAAQTPPPLPSGMSNPIVHAGLFTIRPDGSVGGYAAETASTSGEDITAAVYLAPCGALGGVSGARPLPASATEVWKLSGRVHALTETQVSLELTWQRVRRGGQEVNAPGQTVPLTLARGERTRLDEVTVPAAGVCPERSAVLDVVFASRDELRARPDGAVTTGVGGGSRAGASRGAGVAGSGGGVRVFRATGGGTTTTRLANIDQVPRMPVADLWLVHSTLGAADQTLHVTVDQVTSFPRQFSFAPLAVRTASGVLTVTVQGTIETGLTPEGEPRLYFSANRNVTFAPGGRAARDTAPVVEGSTKTAVAMPGADDVLSFEMPPLRIPGGQALTNRLSIRVRLTSQPMQEVPKPQ
jgi:hypothetical protein